MTARAGDSDDDLPSARLGGGDRAMFGGLAGLVSGFPAQGVISLAWHIPLGTSAGGLIAVAALVFGGVLTGLLWPRRRARHAPRNLQR